MDYNHSSLARMSVALGRSWAVLTVVGVATLLSACSANHNTAYRFRTVTETSSIMTIDAKQRNVLISWGKLDNAVVKMCAEPSPDVFSVFAQSLGASLSGGITSPEEINVAASLALARAETGATISRTQTTNVVREMMFRTCERYLSGAINANQFAIQAIRDQRMVVSVLAIEQLTGVVTPPTVVISASGNASTGGATGEGLRALADAQRAVRTAETNLQTASAKRSNLDKTEPKCADLKDDETDPARKQKREDCKSADAAAVAASSARDSAQRELDALNDLVRQGGLPTMAGTETEGSVVAGLSRPSDEQVRSVTATIDNIVNHIFNQDEFLLFCIGKLAEGSSEIQSACERYVRVGIDAEAKRIDSAAFDRALNAVQVRDRDDFARFWGAVVDPANSTQSDPVRARKLVADLRLAMPGPRSNEGALNDMAAASRSMEALQALFHLLLPAERSRLAELGGK